MAIITVMLPEQVYVAASTEAKRAGVDVAMYCGAMLSDLFLDSHHRLGRAGSTGAKQPPARAPILTHPQLSTLQRPFQKRTQVRPD
jgi:hypothetical protein